ncbi:hypothetical protein PFISCL1PPCAC_26165, partial [Pristionchus fissidentatus]
LSLSLSLSVTLAAATVMLRLICGRIGRMFTSLFAIFQRALCFANKRDNIGELPFHVKSAAAATRPEDRVPLMSMSDDEAPTFAAHPAAAAAAVYAPARAADSWGTQNWDQQVIVESKIEEFRRKKTEQSPAPQEESVDFFSDMTPTLTKPKARLPTTVRPQQQRRNLFEFSEGAAAAGEADLVILDDDDVLEDPAWGEANIDDLLDEHRQKRREERVAQHARRNEERRATRTGST